MSGTVVSEAVAQLLAACEAVAACDIGMLDKAGMTGRAVEEWVVIVVESGDSRAALELIPAGVGKRGSADNSLLNLPTPVGRYSPTKLPCQTSLSIRLFPKTKSNSP